MKKITILLILSITSIFTAVIANGDTKSVIAATDDHQILWRFDSGG